MKFYVLFTYTSSWRNSLSVVQCYSFIFHFSLQVEVMSRSDICFRCNVSSPYFQELKECCGRVFVDSAPEFFPPQQKIIDFSEVDAILISNYLCMLALPFITEGTGFSGVVYATEPTLQIGRSVECLCQE
jgi:hypothetical protein